MWTQRRLRNWGRNPAGNTDWVTHGLRLVGILFLIVATGLLAIGISRPHPTGSGSHNDALGLLALIALLVSVLGAEWVHVLVRPLRPALWAIVTVASMIAIIELPRIDRDLPANGLRVAVGLVVGLIIAKLMLLHRFAAAGLAKRPNPGALTTLLKLQVQDVRRLTAAIDSCVLDRPSQVVQLVGRWGEGKSLLLQHWAATTLEAAAIVDVWKHETEPDLHFALVEELLASPHYVLRFGWLRYPITILLTRSLRDAALKLSLKVRNTVAEIDSVLLPKLPWQRGFEALVRHRRDQGHKTVIVLDEVDRATPSMCQTALTLMRRSLDLPSVVVVLAYVDHVLFYKAFNPLIGNMLPDIASTIEAIIYDTAFSHTLSPMAQGPSSGSIEQWWPAQQRAQVDAQRKERPEELWLADVLRKGFAGARKDIRVNIQARAADKFLGNLRVRVQETDVGTLPEILEVFKPLRSISHEILGSPTQDEWQAVLDRISNAIDQVWRSHEKMVPLRFVESHVYDWLSSTRGHTGDLAHSVYAAVVLWSYQVARLKYS